MKQIYLVSIVIAIVCSGCKYLVTQPTETIYGDGTMTLKFIQLNDVYEIAPLNGGLYGGLARVAHIRDSIKRTNPNTYLFMAGDFLNPSLLGSMVVDGERVNGKQMVEVMNAMEFDLVTFGNHEFDIGEEALQKRINESDFQWTSANVRHATENGLERFKKEIEFGNVPVPDYYSFVATDTLGNSIKLGFFSVTLDSNPRDFVHYGDVYEEAERAYRLVKDKADVVFGLTHVSIEQDIEIAKRLPQVPLIMGGHEHNSMLIREGRGLITKADANARSIYVHTVTYDLVTNYVHIHSKNVPITDKIPSQPAVDRIIKKWNSILDEEMKDIVVDPNDVIYDANSPLDGTDIANRSIQTNLGEIISHAMANSFTKKADAAILNGGSIRLDDNLYRAITPADIFRVLPFGGKVVKVDMKGSLLTKVLDYGESQRGTGAYLQRYNLSQNSTGIWELNGRAISDRKTYTIALSDYLLKGIDIPFLKPENEEIVKVYDTEPDDLAYDIRKAVIKHLKSLSR